ncbi:MAG: phosphoenolpyruvate--protein phosphotransferase [Alcaligenaceae bacterium]|nr:phosphoenolpyruvate--protein phosphotransferase [Alcaligenaceae bacterium]
MSLSIKGIGASPGLAMGNVLIYEEANLEYDDSRLSPEDVAEEKHRLKKAFAESRRQLTGLKERVAETVGSKEAAVFEAHIMILNDPDLAAKIDRKIEEEKKTAPAAVDEVFREYIVLFAALDDDYMKERSADIDDVRQRLLANLMGVEFNPLENLDEKVIIVAEDLPPSATALLDRERVLGLVTEAGGRTSHTAIMACSLEIPAVVGAAGIMESVFPGERILVDGENGEVIVRPGVREEALFRERLEIYRERMEKLLQLRELPAETADGFRVLLRANIGSGLDIAAAKKHGACGVGLFRTEFLFMGRKERPSEKEQFDVYREVAEAFGDQPVTIRTLDIGGDKNLPYIDFPPELNPFLGWRAIRFCLDHRSLFTTQLKAILRASYYGHVKIMYPMISGLEDLREANEILATAKRELQKKGIPFNENIEVGIMIEVPSAALIADRLAREVDFFSIGTNDLIQYTFAVDRMNEKVSRYYQPFHPAILRLLRMTVDGAEKAGIPVGVCGEMAGDPAATELLLGLGIRELSMSAPSIPRVKEKVRRICCRECEKLVEEKIG